jgi:hypothetical protein
VSARLVDGPAACERTSADGFPDARSVSTAATGTAQASTQLTHVDERTDHITRELRNVHRRVPVRVTHRRQQIAAGVDEVPIGTPLMRSRCHQNDPRRASLLRQRHRELRVLHRAIRLVLQDDSISREAQQHEHVPHLARFRHAVLRVASRHDDRRLREELRHNQTVITRRRRIARIEPSGASPYPRITIAGFEKSFVAVAGPACDTAGATPPNAAATATTTAPAAVFHLSRTRPLQQLGLMSYKLLPLQSSQRSLVLRNVRLRHFAFRHRSVAVTSLQKQLRHSEGVRVKIQKLVAPLGITAVAIGMAMAAPASAANNIKTYGEPESLKDVYGNPMITYTVQGLRPSSDAVFHNGRLYEANVTNDGGVPIAALFNARAQSGQNYRIIGGGIPGKIYFDVVGDTPNSVVYNDGVQDLLVWVSPKPISSGAPDVSGESTEDIGGAPTSGATDGGGTTGGNDAAPAVQAPAPFELTPAEVAAPGFNSGGGGGHR